MGNVESIRNKKQKILKAPDSFWCSDLGQSPTNPGLDSITKQQGYTYNGSEDLHDDQYAANRLASGDEGIALPSMHQTWPYLSEAVSTTTLYPQS